MCFINVCQHFIEPHRANCCTLQAVTRLQIVPTVYHTSAPTDRLAFALSIRSDKWGKSLPWLHNAHTDACAHTVAVRPPVRCQGTPHIDCHPLPQHCQLQSLLKLTVAVTSSVAPQLLPHAGHSHLCAPHWTLLPRCPCSPL